MATRLQIFWKMLYQRNTNTGFSALSPLLIGLIFPVHTHTSLDSKETISFVILTPDMTSVKEDTQFITYDCSIKLTEEQRNALDCMVREIIKASEKKKKSDDFYEWFTGLLAELTRRYRMGKLRNPFPEFKKREIVRSDTTSSFIVVRYNYFIPEEFKPKDGLPTIENIFRDAARCGWELAQSGVKRWEGVYTFFDLNITAGIFNYYRHAFKKAKKQFIHSCWSLLTYYDIYYRSKPEGEKNFIPTARKILYYILYLDQIIESDSSGVNH